MRILRDIMHFMCHVFWHHCCLYLIVRKHILAATHGPLLQSCYVNKDERGILLAQHVILLCWHETSSGMENMLCCMQAVISFKKNTTGTWCLIEILKVCMITLWVESALAMEVLQSCTKPSICSLLYCVSLCYAGTNSLRPSDAYMHWWMKPFWFRFMAWSWTGANPLSEPKVNNFNWTSRNKIHYNFNPSSNIFTQEDVFKVLLAKWSFCIGLTEGGLMGMKSKQNT